MARRVQRLVAARYKDRFDVKYMDLFSPEARSYGTVLTAIQEQNLPLPVLALDGQPQFAGEFDLNRVDRLLREVAAEWPGA